MIWVGEKPTSNSYRYLDEDIDSQPGTSHSTLQTSQSIGFLFILYHSTVFSSALILWDWLTCSQIILNQVIDQAVASALSSRPIQLKG